MVSRTPPKAVMQHLRKEVNFGCPVQDCGIPYLTWHHFDPEWKEREHHNPDGMIALCVQHAAIADGGSWTKEQLKEMKQKPFVTKNQISEFYNYQRKSVVCLTGNIAFNVRNILEIDGERVIGFEKDSDGYDTLNILIRDINGSIILHMENNFWTAYIRDLFDLICPARGIELQIISKDKRTDFRMRFDDYPKLEFGNLLYQNGFSSNMILDFISEIGAPERIPVWRIIGTLAYRMYHLRIDNFGIIDMNTQNRIQGSLVIDKNSAVIFENGRISFG